jgi:hypothetical protein
MTRKFLVEDPGDGRAFARSAVPGQPLDIGRQAAAGSTASASAASVADRVCHGLSS